MLLLIFNIFNSKYYDHFVHRHYNAREREFEEITCHFQFQTWFIWQFCQPKFDSNLRSSQCGVQRYLLSLQRETAIKFDSEVQSDGSRLAAGIAPWWPRQQTHKQCHKHVMHGCRLTAIWKQGYMKSNMYFGVKTMVSNAGSELSAILWKLCAWLVRKRYHQMAKWAASQLYILLSS